MTISKLKLKLPLLILTIILTIIIKFAIISPVQAQIPFLNLLQTQTNNNVKENTESQIVSDCIWLDGRCLITVAALNSDLSPRIRQIEQRVNNIANIYFSQDEELELKKKPAGRLFDIYAHIGEEKIRLMSVTSLDANLVGTDIETRTDQLIEGLKSGLEKAKNERTPDFLIHQGIIALITIALILLSSLIISRCLKHYKNLKDQLAHIHTHDGQPISTVLNRREQWNVKEVQYRLLQLTQIVIFIGGSVFILWLFPYTRMIHLFTIITLKIPLKLGLVALGSYLLIRLSYVLINKFSAALVNDSLLTPATNRRLQLRITTISSVSKSIVAITFVSLGVIVGLSVAGVNIAPLLAGLGILSFALSLASQNLIKDAINGFFIIVEDQYAVGDIINVGNVGGLVEYINLRITQLRDAEGKLITIPNSEVRIVANLSSNWARADLNIPIAYQTDVDKGLELITQVAQEMSQDIDWEGVILEEPQVLGVDNFAERGVIIKVWIKTEPLKQWAVSREFRRRIKVAFEQAGIPIPLPQQQVWFQNSSSQN